MLHGKTKTVRIGGALCVLALAGAALLASQATGAVRHSSSTTITFESWVGDSPAVKQLAAEFHKIHPDITISFENVSADSFNTKLATQIAGGNAPDTAYMDSGSVADYASRGALLPLNSYVHTSKIVKVGDYVKAFRDSATYKGQLYGLPIDGESTALFYRTDYFRQAGIKSPPKTWGELQADAAKLTIPSKKQYGFPVFGQEAGYYWYPFFWQAGGQLTTRDGKTPTFDSPAGIKSATFYLGLAKYTPPDFLNSNSWDGRTTFGTGKVAMYEAGAWFAGTMNSEYPKIKGKWAVAPMPCGKKCATTIAGDTLVILKSSKNADAAWKWIEFLSTTKNMRLWNVGTKKNPSSLLPPRTSLLKNPKTFANFPVLKGFASQMKYGVTQTVANPNWPQVEQALDQEFGKVVYGKETAAQALKTVSDRAKSILAGKNP